MSSAEFAHRVVKVKISSEILAEDSQKKMIDIQRTVKPYFFLKIIIKKYLRMSSAVVLMVLLMVKRQMCILLQNRV